VDFLPPKGPLPRVSTTTAHKILGNEYCCSTYEIVAYFILTVFSCQDFVPDLFHTEPLHATPFLMPSSSMPSCQNGGGGGHMADTLSVQPTLVCAAILAIFQLVHLALFHSLIPCFPLDRGFLKQIPMGLNRGLTVVIENEPRN